jgi:hypothetical protein
MLLNSRPDDLVTYLRLKDGMRDFTDRFSFNALEMYAPPPIRYPFFLWLVKDWPR